MQRREGNFEINAEVPNNSFKGDMFMLEKIRLEDCGPFSFNYNAHSLCVVLAEAYEHHQVAYIGGGDALDRLFLRNALLLEWQDKHVEFLSKEAFILNVHCIG